MNTEITSNFGFKVIGTGELLQCMAGPGGEQESKVQTQSVLMRGRLNEQCVRQVVNVF